MNINDKLEYLKGPEEKFSYLSLFYRDIKKEIHLFESLSKDIDWRKLFSLGVSNHLFGFYYRVFKLINTDKIPEDFLTGCRNHFFFGDIKNSLYFKEIIKLNNILKEQNIDYIITRGYVYFHELYDKLPIREFNDIDIYVRKADVEKVVQGLVDAGYTNPGRTKTKYFLNHHIHIRVENPKNKIVFEIHWAVDHKYNLIDIPIEDIIDSSMSVKIEDIKLPVPSIERDFILSAVHALKHSPLLKYAKSKSDCFDMLFRSNYAVKYFDLYIYLLRYRGLIDWELMTELSKRYYCDEYLYIVLSFLKDVFDAPVDRNIIEKLDRYKPGKLENKIAEYLISRSMEKNSCGNGRGIISKAFARIISICKKSLIFNPVRMIDLLRYLYPPSKYLLFLKQKNIAYLRRNRLYLFMRGLFLLFKNLLDAMLGRQDLLLDD